jgi:outer membrane receptor protein involved in Fe transport
MTSRFVSALVLVLATAAPVFAWQGRIVTTDGRPIAGATISILGRAGEAITDAEGRFVWRPDPTPPFEILVIQSDGTYMKPVTVESLGDEPVTITVESLLSEAVTVSGSAPGIESTPGAGTTTLSGREVDVRQPTNLMQAIENVAGVSQVSEGQAAVPAVRGLARGRTLILIDGARVTSERRAGPSATYLDPSIVEGVDVARGPGSVAYGSDAFGGVISIRTRRVTPATPLEVRFAGTAGTGIPDRRLTGQISKGLPAGSVLFAAHTREADDWDSPEGEVFNSGFSDHGFLGRVEQQIGAGMISVGWQSDFGRDIERPRNNSRIVRFYYPYEDSHRFTGSYEVADLGGFKRMHVNTFFGTYGQRTDQDRFATATAGRSIERADIEAKDYGVRAYGERLLGRARVEMGVDLNGRFGLEALDDLITYDLAGNIASSQSNVSIEDAHRTDTGLYASIDTALTAVLSLGAGVRGDYVVTTNTGGYFGDLSTGNGGGSGYVALTAGSFGGFSTTLQVARGFRDPTLSDRYYRGPTGRGYITGNPELNPETSLQLDLSARYTTPRYRLAAFYYQYRIDDLIERYQTTIDNFFFRNRGRARIRGFEVEGQADLGAGFTVDLATQVAEGRSLDDDAYLDDVSPLNLTTVLRKSFGARAFAQARLAFFAEDDNYGPTERPVPGYTLLDMAAGYNISAPLELRIQARNLLNEEYLASQDVRTVSAPGRSASITLAVKF